MVADLPLDLAQVADYFEAVRGSAAAAFRARPAVTRTYRVAGIDLRLHAAGPALLDPLAEALAHLEAPVASAALTVDVWDSESTGVRPPPAPLAWYARLPGSRSISYATARRLHADGRIPAFNRDPFRLMASHDWPHALQVLRLDTREGLFWYRDPAALSHERSTPFREFFAWLVRARGDLFLHGAAVGEGGRGVLLLGDPGAGKSTSALACLDHGMEISSDDCVVVSRPPAPRAHSLYSVAKLKGPDDLARFPRLAGQVVNGDRLDREKALFHLHRTHRDRLRASMGLCALLMPRVTGAGRARLVPARAADALGAMAPSSVRQYPGARAEDVHAMIALTRALPAYFLEIGPTLETIPAAIRALLKDLE